ncbi:nucleotidyltransferase family protein [Thioclava sp. FR2]|uniref:nucleotidyltransferase family protein n=1 Tax=Thioclava sp. FR2 TaxID=3445780 RepID=UPI003EB6976B
MSEILHIIVLAAGASSRMAPRDKLLENVGGQPLLARITRFALETTCPVTVVLPTDRPLRNAAIAGLPVQRVFAEKARDGMAESIKAGVGATPDSASLLLVLADLPEIDLQDFETMISAWKSDPSAIFQGCSATGIPGHPVIIPAHLRSNLQDLTGDIGAKPVLKAHQTIVRQVPLPTDHAITDLDTPEAWDIWRKSQAMVSGAKGA